MFRTILLTTFLVFGLSEVAQSACRCLTNEGACATNSKTSGEACYCLLITVALTAMSVAPLEPRCAAS